MMIRTLVRVSLAVLFLAPSVLASAQSPNTAAIAVVVRDQTGAVVPGAAIAVVNTATGAVRQAQSGASGATTISALQVSGRYVVTVRKEGFAEREVRDLQLRAGETATVAVTLAPSGVRTDVAVYGTVEGVRRDPQLGMRLDESTIELTPIPGRKVTALPLLNSAFRSARGTGDLFLNNPLFVANAGGRRQTTVAVDGATGDDPWGRQTMFSNVPVAAVQEMTVLSNAFSAEFGWTTSSAINLVTKSGTNVLHGEALLDGRPSGLQKRRAVATLPGGSAVARPDVPDTLLQGSFALGGPVVPDRAHFFFAVEATRQDRTAALTSPLRTGEDYVGRYKQLLADGRVDHRVSQAHSLMARVNIDRMSDSNPQDVVSGLTLPSAGRRFSRSTYSVQGNATSVLSSRMLNEARVEWQNGDPITAFDPVTPSTQFTRAGVATEGESRFAHVYSRQIQFSDTLSLSTGGHLVRVGGSVGRATSGGDGTEFGSAFTRGQFTVNPAVRVPLSSLTLSDVTRYTQSFDLGVNTYENRQWIFALFAQDSLRLRDDLTLEAGVRYDRQTVSDARANFAPRVGAAWNPFGDPRTVVRGGYGMYFSQLRANIDASFTLGGPEGLFTYSAAPGQPGFPTSISAAPIAFPAGAVLPPRNITIRPGEAEYYARFFDVSKLTTYPGALVNPRSQVISVGIEREVASHLFLSADYVHQHWDDIDRMLDLNAPAPFDRTAPGQIRSVAAADLTRPIVPVAGGFRQIAAIVNAGEADYDGLQARVTSRSARHTLSVSYTLSKSTNTVEPDAPGGAPNDSNHAGEEERGPSQLDQRHRAVITASYRLPHSFIVGTFAQFASARPYNATTGVDNNGDGSTTDRPVVNGTVVSRNAYRGSGTSDVAFFVEEPLRTAHGTLTFRAELFNAFDHANVVGRNGVYGNGADPVAAFGTASAGLANIEPGRMLQVQMRYGF